MNWETSRGTSGDWLTVVNRGDTLSRIVRDSFGPFASDAEWAAKVEDVARRSHIKHPAEIYPGQIVALGDIRVGRPFAFAAYEMNEMRHTLGDALPTIWRVMERHWDILSHLDSTPARFTIGGRSVDGYASPLGLEIWKKASIKTVEEFVTLEGNPAFQRRVGAAAEMVAKALRQQAIHVRSQAGLLGSRPVIYAETGTVKVLPKLAKMITTKSSFAALMFVMPTVDTYNAYRQRGPQAALTTAAKGYGGAAIGVVGGEIGATVGYIACNLAFGIESAGTSLAWCVPIAEIIGGTAGSILATHGYDTVFDRLSSSLKGSDVTSAHTFALPPLTRASPYECYIPGTTT